MQGLRAHTPLVPLLVPHLGPEEPFRLVDIGGLGVQAQGWRDFADRLDILSVQNDQGPEAEPPARLVRRPLELEWTWRAQIKEQFADNRMFQMPEDGSAPEPVTAWLARDKAPPDPDATPAAGLLEAIDQEGFGAADFLKIDTGAQDFANLRALEPLLGRPTLLGVSVRAVLSGGLTPDANVLANVDALLRRRGFDLFALEPVHYSSAVLPFPFVNPSHGATLGGKPLYMRVIYLRPTDGLPTAGLLKAAALRAMIDLPDQAAEVLATGGARLPSSFDLPGALEKLTVQVQENTGSQFPRYAAYLSAFEARHPIFYDFRVKHQQWLDRLRGFRRDWPKRISELEDVVRELSKELVQSGRKLQIAEADRTGHRKAKAATVAGALAQVGVHSRLYPGNHWLFDCYRPYRGPTDGVHHFDFLGVRTLPEYDNQRQPQAVDAFESALPTVDEEYFEWLDVMQAALEAGPCFTMLELGAGYGRWSARGALAARQLGKAVRLGAVEADPRHVAWLKAHLALNGVSESELRVVEKVIGGKGGEVAFAVGTLDGEGLAFGQAAIPPGAARGARVGDYFGAPMYEIGGWRAILAPAIPLSEVLKPYDVIDLADFDIQGAEGEAIAEAIGPLTHKARRLHIGTHSLEIEAQLRNLLPRHGWAPMRDYSLRQTHDTPFGPATFLDGVQTWINPALLLNS